jgi:hypothetical protein
MGWTQRAAQFLSNIAGKLSKKGQAADIEDARDTGNSKEAAAQSLSASLQKRWLFCPLGEQPDTGRIHTFIFERITVNGEGFQSDSASG